MSEASIPRKWARRAIPMIAVAIMIPWVTLGNVNTANVNQQNSPVQAAGNQ